MEKSSYRLGGSSTAFILGLAIIAIVAVHHEILGYPEETAIFISDRIFYLALSWILGKRALDLVTKGSSSGGTPPDPDAPREFEEKPEVKV